MSDREEQPWETALEWIEELIDIAGSLPEKSANFGFSVVENLEGMKKWVTEKKFVTTKQLEALESWDDALNRCISE